MFQLWASAGNIQFERATETRADIEIRFETEGFNRGVLGRAYIPVGSGRNHKDGNVHINDNEKWGTENVEGGKCKIKPILNISGKYRTFIVLLGDRICSCTI